MADQPKSGLLQRLGSGFDRYIGGLLGEDLEGLSPEEKSAARRSGLGIIARGLIDPSQGSEALGAVTQARTQQRAREELARRTAAAEAAMPDLASRIFGGTGGRSIEALPGAGGEAMPMTARRVPTREGAREALGMLYGTQAGQDAATMAPGLVDFAKEGVTGRTVGGSVYNPLTGRFDSPRKAGTTTLTPAEVRQLGAPAGTIIQRDADGKLSVLSVPRAVGGGGGGIKYRIIPPDEMKEKYPAVALGTVLQENQATGEVTKVQEPSATQRASEQGKSNAVTRVDNVASRIIKQMDKVKTGGMLGGTGAMSFVFDSQDAKLFETYRQQLSTALRTALRIPGEGALSDRDLAQNGLTLPSLSQSRENNLAILESLSEQVRLSAGQDIPQVPAPGAGAAGSPPLEVTAQEWANMTPEERALFKK